MFINEYGDKNNPLILLLAPMMVSGEDLYQKKTIPIYMPEAELVIRPGFRHCGYMATHPKEYAEEIEAFIRRNRNVLG